MELTFTIDDAKLDRLLDAFEGIWPIPVYPSGHPQEGQPQYTKGQWARWKAREFLINTVFRYETKVAVDEAKQSITKDDTIVT